jgi:uncharacterized protein (AIM24 family)
MKHSITGTTMPVLQIGLDPGEKIIAEPGEFSWMSDNMQLHTTTQTAGARGLFGAIGRALSGGGLFMTEYTPTGGPGLIAFSAKVPGSIQQIDIPAGHSYMIHKHGFLCATEGVNLSVCSAATASSCKDFKAPARLSSSSAANASPSICARASLSRSIQAISACFKIR